MTSKDIKASRDEMIRVRDTENRDTAAHIEMAVWLKEIAYQLAIMNERNAAMEPSIEVHKS